jgi:peptide/nickel transport system permease protein
VAGAAVCRAGPPSHGTQSVVTSGTDLLLEEAGALEPPGSERPAGVAPWRLALRRLRRNKTALAFGALFIVLVALCLAAPLYAKYVAHTDPYKNHLTDVIKVDGKPKDVVSPDGVPIGPTWQGRFFLGADDNGRDIAVRLLYGGRTSLEIGVAAAVVTTILSVLVGLVAGYFRGRTDAVLARILDVIWAYPVILLGVALGTALALGGLKLGPIEISGTSLAIPIGIIAIVYIPYMARPIRGQVLGLREKEFVEAARTQGARPLRIMFSEILPNLSSTIVVFFPLMVANAILLEAALSFLGAGVRPPNPSWGTMIGAGVDRIVTGPHEAIVPGLMLVLTVLALNVFGDGVRDAFDPRAKVRVEG